MELSWVMKLRIAAAAAVGIALIGVLAWPLAESSAASGSVNYGGAAILVLLAFAAGLAAFFLSWPYGWEIGILAAPFGLAFWAVRSGSMADLIRLNPTVAQRQALVASLRLEPIFWLLIVAAGFAGPLLCRALLSKKDSDGGKKKQQYNFLSAIAALAGSAVVAHLFIRMFAQDIRHSDSSFHSVTAQPAIGQVAFAVLVSFGFAAFLAKKYLNASYIWPSIATGLVTAFAVSAYSGKIQYLTQNWPVDFFPNAVISILPVQMVAFGTLGSVAGYWMAMRYDYWRQHESG
ncbi:MAG: hypothetical protein ABIF19_09940 [Planctomycetota bacterium]